jgi:hypothetical protein
MVMDYSYSLSSQTNCNLFVKSIDNNLGRHRQLNNSATFHTRIFVTAAFLYMCVCFKDRIISYIYIYMESVDLLASYWHVEEKSK